MKTLFQLRHESQKIFKDGQMSLCKLLFSWTQLNDNDLYDILEEAGIDSDLWTQALTRIIKNENIHENQNQNILRRPRLNLPGAVLLLDLCKDRDKAEYAEFENLNINLSSLRSVLSDKGFNSDKPESEQLSYKNFFDDQIKRTDPDIVKPLLDVGYNLTELAASGKFDDYSFRPEINLLSEAMLSYNKSNVLITGPAGVGKSALVEYYARQMFLGEVPKRLRNHQIFCLSISSIVSSTKWRGEFEQKVEGIIEAYFKIKPAILFIDEFADIIGAGRVEGSTISVHSILLPHLARENGIKVIGATTTEEYEQYLKPSTAFMRRFTVVELQEPLRVAVLQMAKLQCKTLAKFHDVKISDNLIEEAYDLAEHLEGRYNPDKTMFLLQKAFVKAEIRKDKSVKLDHLFTVLNEVCKKSIGELMGV